LSLQGQTWEGVDADFGAIAFANVAQLRLPVVCLDPDLPLDQRNHLSARTDQLSGPHLALPDDPVFRRGNPCIAQVRARQLQRGLPGFQVRAQELFLRIQYGPLAALSFEFSPATLEAGAGG